MDTSIIMTLFRANSNSKYKLESLANNITQLKMLIIPFMPVGLQLYEKRCKTLRLYSDESHDGQSGNDHVEPLVKLVVHNTASNRLYPVHSFIPR